MKDSKLTSVKVIDSLYKKFKIETINNEMNLQKLLNRSMHLYLEDKGFKELVVTNDALTISGSSL
jgi:hypothetical protein